MKYLSLYYCYIFQIGTNNCTARYRTLSGGIGESPSPTPSSDYDDNLTATAGHNNGTSSGSAKTAANNTIVGGATNLNNLTTSKTKRNNLATAHNKGLQISQKATVHYVSIVQLFC